MKSLLLISVFSAIIAGSVYAKTYYVSTTGNNSNSGLTEALAWKTITYAASSSSPAVAGDIIYIKSGNYGAEYVSFQKSGSAGSPIVFEGYQTTPGDAPNLNFKMGDALNAAIMPLLNGGDRAQAKVGFNLPGRSYIVLKNFQITNYGYGVNTGDAHHITLDNVITMYTGSITDSYSGRGIQFGSWSTAVSSYNTINNCVVVNSAAEGLSVNGNNNTITNCRVYCNEGVTGNAATDYYLLIDGNNNTISGCYVNRMGNLAHYGHGIGAKWDSKYNLFENCTSINMAEDYYARHRGASYNTFKNCKALYGYAFVVRDGASHNTFIGCISDSAKGGLRIHDTSEDGGAQYSGRHNIFKNCIIKNAYMGVYFDSYDQVSPADSNTIANCTFDNIDYLFYCGRPNSENKMINCIVSNADNLKSGSYALSFNFTYTNFFNNAFTAQSGAGNTSVNPLYANAALQDYHLQPGSACKDAGTALTYVSDDYDVNPRPQGNGYDMGAYEFQAGGAPLSATISSKNVSCNAASNGSATITVTSGKTPYTYSWNNGQTTAVSSGLNVGSYSVIVSDATTASKSFSVVITQPSPLTSSIASQTNVKCNGGSNGSVTVVPAGGTAGYSYLWSPSNQTTATVTGLRADNYTVKITDANGCISTTTVTITQPSLALTSSIVSQTNVKCNGSNGSATVASAGGTGAYTYLWSPTSQTTPAATGLSAGNYTAKTTDANGCTTTVTATITQTSSLTSSLASQTNVKCNGESNGSATVAAAGGVPVYTYLWSPTNQTAPAATGLSAGTYIAKITDANGCTTNATVTITQPSDITNTITSQKDVSCYGGNNGGVTITPVGGTTPYTYLWSPSNQTTATATGLSAAGYTFTVYDAKGCKKSKTVTVTQPDAALVSNLSVTNASICTAKDGKILASVTGGTPNYSYAWSTSPVQITYTASGLAPGSYSVIISDANGCSTASTASVTCNTTTDISQSERENSFNVFPNPATGPFNVVISSPAMGNEILVVVRNLLGEEFYSKVFVVSNSTQVIAVDYSGSLTPGVYMVIATSNDSIFEKKIVIQ